MAGKDITIRSGHGSNDTGGDLKIIAGNGNGSDKKGGDLFLSTGVSRGNTSNAIKFATALAGDSGTGAREPTERMRIHTNGFVGIGTDAPNATLLQLEGENAYLTLKNTTDENGDGQAETEYHSRSFINGLALIQGSHDGSDNDSKGKLLFVTNNNSELTTAMVIDSNQNVGIGTTSPVNKLEIKTDTTTGNQLRLTDKDSTSENPKYTDIYQTDGHFYIKSSGSGTDIILQPLVVIFNYLIIIHLFGGFFPNSNNFHIYSARNNYAIKFQNKVSSSFQQILELNKTNNLSTFDSNIKLNGSMIYNTNSSSKTTSFSIDFESSSSGDYEFTIDPSTLWTLYDII